MGFDDLAKHMAVRDGKKKSALAIQGSADEIMAAAAIADSQMQRTRDKILGSILLIGGAIALLMYALYVADLLDPKPNPMRPPSGGKYPVSFLLPVGFIGAMIYGVKQLIRGFRRVR